MNVSRWPIATAAISATVSAALLISAAPASAHQTHPSVVSEHPVNWTPHFQDGTVNAITMVDDTIVVGGTFTEVHDSTGQQEYDRTFLAAFGRHDGQLTDFTADLDGPVDALAPGPDGTVYAGGTFHNVNGQYQRGVTQLRLDSGQRVSDFQASINWGDVLTIAWHEEHLYLGGRFTAINGTARAGLARLDATTGEVDTNFDARLSNQRTNRTNVQDLTLSPEGDRLVAVGAFTHAEGWRRPEVMMMDTASQPAALADWYTDAFELRCAPEYNTFLRGVDFAPDGSYFVTVTSGGLADPDRLCNSAARFDATGTGMHQPAWVNHTGGNTLLSVEVTGPAVYVGGHQQWMDNPYGDKSAGPGAVEREGIAAVDPDEGTALPWNPGRARGVGVQDFLATPEGLFVGSDTTRLGGVTRERIGMFPMPETTPPTDPDPPMPSPEPPTPSPEPPTPSPEPPMPNPEPWWTWLNLEWLFFLLHR